MESWSADIPRVRRGDLDFLPETEIAAIAKTANALSDPIRLQILHLLSQREDLCTCEFEELLEQSQSKISYHLNLLLQSGFITRENRGIWSHYRLSSPNALHLIRLLAGKGQEQAGPVHA